ncbi:MAG: hypothetical protein CVT49_15970 [candidate division Zixibacteria bacterium HGW-Zixibacteria-1]|nr:MAG: hypothetical protein CVT49_15970 [candidate division Zixibacteria bacterium HGW-Zixibacteria-1]
MYIGGIVKKHVFVLVIFLMMASIAAGQSKLDENFNKLSGEILNNLQAFSPVLATAKGIHDYDYRFTDYSSKGIINEIAALKKFETRIYKYQKSDLSPENQIDLKLLKSNVDIALAELNKTKFYNRNPFIYIDDAVYGIYLILASDYAPLENRVQNIIARMKVVPDLLSQARKNLKAPPPVFTDAAIEMVNTGVDFYRSMQSDLSGQFPILASEINIAVDRAVSSMLEYKHFLENITPGDPKSFAVGRDHYDYLLQHQYFLDFNSDSLLKIGENLLEETKQLYNEYLADHDPSNSQVDSVFVLDCLTKDDILRYYNWEVDQTKLYLNENNIVTVPDDIGRCLVIETPPFLTGMISTLAYEPPGEFSPVQTGYFYVRPIPDTMDAGQRAARYKYINRRGFKGGVVHEAYPGHHLQMQMASLLDDDVRKWQDNMLLKEGWALYCEEMMYNSGFYGSDDRQYLRVLGGIAFRAARIIVDVKLQTGQMSVEEAIKWMAETTESDTSTMRTEINWYVQKPTVPMTYLTGKLEILKLLDEVKAREGENFSLQDFHDRLLAEGSLPPALIRERWGLDQ